MLPRPDPQPARPTEKAACQGNNSPEDQEHGKGHYRYLAISIGTTGVAINIRQDGKGAQHKTRDEYTSRGRREVVQQFLQA